VRESERATERKSDRESERESERASDRERKKESVCVLRRHRGRSEMERGIVRSEGRAG